MNTELIERPMSSIEVGVMGIVFIFKPGEIVVDSLRKQLDEYCQNKGWKRLTERVEDVGCPQDCEVVANHAHIALTGYTDQQRPTTYLSDFLGIK